MIGLAHTQISRCLAASALLLSMPALAAAPVESATATMADASGQAEGQVTLKQVSQGVEVVIDVSGLSPGVHGIHIHTIGKCDGPDFKTAGGHWNPTMKVHGKDAPGGMHEGDLPNITVDADGTVHAAAMIRDATLTGGAHPLLDDDGAAVVIHEKADDYRTDPSGNSGARISCGVVTPA